MTSEKRNWFEAWFNSPYYHLLYDHRDEQEARRFISKLIAHLNPPAGSKMLDLACGKGRHAAQLAEYGYEVTGLDIAEDSILAARRQYNSPRLQFDVHDMRKPLPFPQEHFDYVFNLFTSFGYFETEAEHLQTLHNIAYSLKSGGTFVMDFMNAEKVIAKLVPEEQIQKKGLLFHIRRWQDEAGYINKEIRFTPPESTTPLCFTERVRAYRKDELKDMLAQAGLPLRETFGNYELQPFNPAQSDRCILLAEKRITDN